MHTAPFALKSIGEYYLDHATVPERPDGFRSQGVSLKEFGERFNQMYVHPIKLLELLNGQVQYVIPRWQRRYCWGQSDIERLVDDLMAVSRAVPGAIHYGGTLLTFPEPGAAGVVSTIRVVDGQQRLTTVSILLSCIADELGPDGECEGWTRQFIREDRLTNHGKSPEKHRKLRLQGGDEEEYRLGLEGKPEGPGAVAQAWKIARRLVVRNGIAGILKGLDRLTVVSIGLHENEDPQQIFESLNATGRPLEECEKVKNWLLLGLPNAEQKHLHENHWLRIERLLGAMNSTEPVDLFLRDWIRWRTGETQGIKRVYEGIRRWAIRNDKNRDRPAICRELAGLAELYGMLTGTADPPKNAIVARELRHLREMGLDVYRPFALRLLNDAYGDAGGKLDDDALAGVLALIGTWTTRMWLANKPLAGMNKAMAELAHEIGPDDGANPVEYWRERIYRRKATQIGVPEDQEIQLGIRNRRVSGTNIRAARAVLCELMEAEHREEAPDRGHLTVEHVMPQKLTDDWKRDLDDEAGEIHKRYLNCLPNLTLSGDITNSEMGANSFAAKKKFYERSSIGMTRKLADEDVWSEDALERRAEDLARRALERWPWHERHPISGTPSLQWRLGDGSWQREKSASGMVKNVAATLLSLHPENARRLSGEALRPNVHSSRRYPPGSSVGSFVMRAVPKHPDFVIYPYEQNHAQSKKRCIKMGERCGVVIEVELAEASHAYKFWRLLKEKTGGLPGQTDQWLGPIQWTEILNSAGERIGIGMGSNIISLYVRARAGEQSDKRTLRMQQHSRAIIREMSDQQLGTDTESESHQGRSISVKGSWGLDDESDWPSAAVWVKEQFERLRIIVADE